MKPIKVVLVSASKVDFRPLFVIRLMAKDRWEQYHQQRWELLHILIKNVDLLPTRLFINSLKKYDFN